MGKRTIRLFQEGSKLVSVVRCVDAAAAAAARYSSPGICRVLTHSETFTPSNLSVVCCPCSVCALDFPSRHKHQRTTSLGLMLEILSERQPWTKTTMRSSVAYSRFCDWLNKWDYACLINAIASPQSPEAGSPCILQSFSSREIVSLNMGLRSSFLNSMSDRVKD